jgi:hypothetical protein
VGPLVPLGRHIRTAEPPSPAARGSAALGELRDPEADAAAIDYDRFQSDLVVDVLLGLCRTARAAAGPGRLLGTFYGYAMWETGMANATPSKGHCALARLLAADEIDFVTGIASYDNRALGGPGSFMLPPASVALHGKILWTEEDLRTHLGKPM